MVGSAPGDKESTTVDRSLCLCSSKADSPPRELTVGNPARSLVRSRLVHDLFASVLNQYQAQTQCLLSESAADHQLCSCEPPITAAGYLI